MAIDAYVGVPGVAVNVETPKEVYEAVDLLHTQVLDNISEHRDEILKVLNNALDELQKYDE